MTRRFVPGVLPPPVSLLFPRSPLSLLISDRQCFSPETFAGTVKRGACGRESLHEDCAMCLVDRALEQRVDGGSRGRGGRGGSRSRRIIATREIVVGPKD